MNNVAVILGIFILLSVSPALAQRLPADRTDVILQSMNEKVVEIKTKVEKIDETVTKLDKTTTGNIATIQTNQEWLIWWVRGLAGALLGLTVYVFRDKLFGRNSNGNGKYPSREEVLSWFHEERKRDVAKK